MESKLNGIVIKSVNYSENDKILTIFTLEQGVISAKIKGVKKAGAKLKFASEPFCFSEYITLGNEGKRIIINATIRESFYPLRTDIKKFYLGNVALEFIKLFCLENSVYGEFFLSSINYLKELSYSETDPKILAIKFLIEALAFIGYEITLDKCIKCNQIINGKVFFDFEEGGTLCENCRNEDSLEISELTYKTLKSVKNNENFLYEEKYLLRSLKFLSKYIQDKTGETIKSLEEFFLL